MKYLLSVRQDMIDEILPLVFDSIFSRLKDPIDDVSAVAAAALVPVKDALIKTLPHAIGPTLKFLWDALLEIDDLTSSTSSILMLLSSLLTFGDNCSNGLSLDALLPRLWPFLGHAMTAVRKSVLEALLILVRKSLQVDWMQEESYKTALSLTYQRSLVENDPKVSRLLQEAWSEMVNRSTSPQLLFLSSNFVAGSICLMMHPAKFPLDSTTSPVWVTVKHHKQSAGHEHEGETYEEKAFIGGYDLSENPATRERAVLTCRIAAGKMLAILSEHLTTSSDHSPAPITIECLSNLFLFHLNSKSSLQRMCVGLILQEWAMYKQSRGCGLDPQPKPALDRCLSCLEENVSYDEISTSFARLQQEVRDFVSFLNSNKVPISSEKFKTGSIFTFDQINELLTVDYPNAFSADSAKFSPAARETMNERSRNLSKALANTTKYQTSLITVTSSMLASAVIAWNVIPSKLNPLIRPLMDCIRREENESVQDLAAIFLSRLLSSCPAPAAKVVKNLVTFACSDPIRTPVIGAPVTPFKYTRSNSQTSCPSTPSTPSTPEISFKPIIMLNNMQKAGERNGIRRSVSLVNKKNAPADVPFESPAEDSSEQIREIQVTTRGATAALIQIVSFFGDSLPSRIPQLWNHFTVDVRDRQIESVEDGQLVVQALQVIEITAKYLSPSLKSYLCDLLPNLCLFAESAFPEVRHLTSRCMAALSLVITSEVMDCVVDRILPVLASHAEVSRQGAVECIAHVIESLGLKIVPYIVLLIVPMLARMSDQCEHVRLLATHCFAQLIQLMPLDNENRSETLDRKDLMHRKQEERKFLEQLMDPKKLENFTLPIPVKAELRSYQQQGVNWLAFLNRYNLHGILCDEMGLGKTLMSICILASDHCKKKTSDSVSKTLPSLVVCPPTLTGHWAFEVNKFVGKKHLNPIHYTGSPAERNKIKDKLKKQIAKSDPDSGQNLVVASYDIVRNDIDFFSSMTWNYCILDEGHIIKNGKTKLSKAIKSLHANHRLILTGTPIQNNVLELWSLFDFLMPGFLGTEKQFVSRFSRPILQSRDAKSSSKEQEAGVLAMDALHRQVLPFILRRMKEDVLKDLPPKIMQDYYCDLSPLQARLYEDFAKSRVKQNMEKDLIDESCSQKVNNEPKVASHIFQALQYLRKVCNHPKLVLTPNHPEYHKITSQLQQQDSSLSDVSHATKLCALRQLLLDCGIGTQNISSSGNLTVVNQHRALIFCQLKSMLDIVEQDLLKTHMSSVSYLRLDGSIPPGARHSVVHRFNNDPSIDVLLLTTQVCWQ
jgi:TATA-binding protein-associated factor